MVWVGIAIAGVAGVVLGYAIAVVGTWARLHRQESELRALINAVVVERSMNRHDSISSTWVQQELETMLHKEYG
jgi:hypothetical protein